MIIIIIAQSQNHDSTCHHKLLLSARKSFNHALRRSHLICMLRIVLLSFSTFQNRNHGLLQENYSHQTIMLGFRNMQSSNQTWSRDKAGRHQAAQRHAKMEVVVGMSHTLILHQFWG